MIDRKERKKIENQKEQLKAQRKSLGLGTQEEAAKTIGIPPRQAPS